MELKSLTMGGNTYDSFVDVKARESSAGYYHTGRIGFEKANELRHDDIYELYRALGPSEENTLYDFKGEATALSEFVFSTGDYNTFEVHGDADDVHKPVFLVTSGIHGDEITAVLATYRFFADLVSGKNLPSFLKEGAIFKVVPLVNPSGFDARTRGNTNTSVIANGVNLNRNFDYKWKKENPKGSWNNYTGESVASESETQAITNWLIANKDAVVFFDMHSAASLTEYSGLVGLETNTDVIKAKKIALRGLDKVVPYWKSLLDNADGITFHYSSHIDGNGAMVYYAANSLGIPSVALECISDSKSQQFDGIWKIIAEYPNEDTIAIGAEVLGNALMESYKKYAFDVKVAKKYSTITEALAGGNGTAEGTVIAYNTDNMLNIVLTEDMTASEIIEVTKDCTIHLNGHKLTFETGKHFYLTSGKLTINGSVSKSKVCKTIDINKTTQTNSESLVVCSVNAEEGAELRLFGGTYYASGTANGGIVLARGETITEGNNIVASSGAKMTLLGCTMQTDKCSGTGVFAIQTSTDTYIDKCYFKIGVTKASYCGALNNREGGKLVISNTTAEVKNTDTSTVISVVQCFGFEANEATLKNCTIEVEIPNSSTTIAYGVSINKSKTEATVQDSQITVIGNPSKNVYAINNTSGTIHIDGGYYKGSKRALNLSGTVHINGEQVDGTAYTAQEYDFRTTA